uniref:7TM_GPCR_Srx domain-containing protein n=1 Tax=Caenorhabditis tropicalis TaxID=1561998 RepID=A0A1I7V1U5_9PELO
MDSANYTIADWPNAVATVMMIVNSAIGLFFNFLIIFSFIVDKKQKTSFNLICVFRSINNNLIIIILAVVYVPATVIGYSIFPRMVETIVLTTALNLKVYNEFQSIYLSINRLVAIYFPLKYNLVFGIKATLAFHFIYYADRVRNLTFENIDRYNKSVFMLYSVKHLAYGGVLVTPDGMFLWALGLLVFPFFVNAFTFARFYYLKNQMSHNSEKFKNAKKNMGMFFQTVLQDSLFSISVIFTLKMNTLIDHRFYTFFSQTFLWQSIHVIDGLIMLLFNERLLMKKLKRISPADNSKHTSTAAAAVNRLPNVH